MDKITIYLRTGGEPVTFLKVRDDQWDIENDGRTLVIDTEDAQTIFLMDTIAKIVVT